MKISAEDINFILQRSSVKHQTEFKRAIAFVDFANLAYSLLDAPKQDTNRLVFNESDSEKIIDFLSAKFTEFIKNMPKEVQKVIIFATENDSNLHGIKLNSETLPFSFKPNDLEKVGIDRFDIENSFFAPEDEMERFPLTTKPDSLSVPFEELDKEKQEALRKEAEKLTQILKLPKLSKFDIRETHSNYSRKSFCNYLRIPEILNLFHCNIVEKVKWNLRYVPITITKKQQKRKQSVSKNHGRKIEIIHVESSLEDDFTMRLVAEDFREQFPNFGFYIYSSDRDVIGNFAGIKNCVQFFQSSSNPSDGFSRTSIDDFWNGLLSEELNENLSNVSKRIIWGFLGSDYTTPIMNRNDIRRLDFKNKENPSETLKKFINRKFINGRMSYSKDEISDKSILKYVKYLSETIKDDFERNLFICSFDALIGFEKIDFHILNQNSIRFASVSEYFEEVRSQKLFEIDWHTNERFFIEEDLPGELEYETIKVMTKDGLKEFKNQFVSVSFSSNSSEISGEPSEISLKSNEKITVEKPSNSNRKITGTFTFKELKSGSLDAEKTEEDFKEFYAMSKILLKDKFLCSVSLFRTALTRISENRIFKNRFPNEYKKYHYEYSTVNYINNHIKQLNKEQIDEIIEIGREFIRSLQ